MIILMSKGFKYKRRKERRSKILQLEDYCKIIMRRKKTGSLSETYHKASTNLY